MKITKIIAIALLSILTVFATVGCTDSYILDNFLRVTDNMKNASVTYTESSLAEEETTIEVVMEPSGYQVETLGYHEAIELTEVTDDLTQFNELRLEIIALHDELILVRDQIQSLAESIRISVETIQKMGYVLLPGDKEILQEDIQTIKEFKAQLLETKGMAYQRIYDLQGSYTRDNLAVINQTFIEVIEVLEYRLEVLAQATEILEKADLLLKDYWES